MKRIIPWLLTLVVLLVIGCGGGGGGGSTTDSGGGTGTTYTNLQVGTVVGSVFVDPSNIIAGETLNLAVYGRDTSGNLVTVPGAIFSSTAPSSVAIVSSSGQVTGISASTNLYTVTATVGTNSVSATLRVRGNGAQVSGRLQLPSGAGLRFAEITFFNASGTEVGSAVTGVDGTFRGVMPTTATQFTLNIDTSDPTNLYYRQFTLDSSDFLMEEPTCYAPLPSLTNGTLSDLGSVYLTAKSSGPPPPPGGCVG